MEPNHLLEDEFAIECMVRSLEGEPSTLCQQLRAQLELEKVNPALVPNKPHVSAYKGPRREIKICGVKLLSFREWLKLNPSENGGEYEKLKSRILHVEERLNRMKFSKVVKVDVEKLLGEAKQLFEFVEKYIVDSSDMSVDNLNDLTFEVSEGDDFEDIVIGHSTKIVKKVTEPIASTSTASMHQLESNDNNISVQAGCFPKVSDNQAKANELQESESGYLRELLGKQKLEHLIEMLNEVILTKSALLTTQELRNVDHLYSMATPPSRTPNKTFIPSRQNPHLSYNQESRTNENTNFSKLIDQINSTYSAAPEQNFVHPDARQPSSLDQTFVRNERSTNNQKTNFTFLKRDPSTWGLTFHGSTRDPPIEHFLFRVESIALGVFHINLDQLVNEFCVFLKDDAQNWYWSYRQRHVSSVISYVQFRNDIISRFRDSQTDFDIRFRLNSRKQLVRENEDFRKFYDEVLRISSRLKIPINDVELLEILRRNMRPGLQLALANRTFTNLDDLLRQCVSLETMWSRLGYFPEAFVSNPPKRVLNEIESCVPSSSMNFCQPNDPSENLYDLNAFNVNPSKSFPAKQNNESLNTNQYSQRNSDPKSLMICFNCEDIGHHFKDCQSPIKRVFCHGCGEKGIYLPQCQKCRPGNLNFFARSKHPGMSLPQTANFPPNQAQNLNLHPENSSGQNA